jgi:hypothetical protein
MYLMDSSAPPVNNRKWNLGRMRGLGCGSCPSRGMGCASCPRGGTASSSALDYTSPQAAIIAGLDPNTVVAAWTKALARFPSPQAAISAGVPAGVVNQLWQQSNVNAANAVAGRDGMGRLGLSPVRLPNLGASGTAQSWRRMGRLRGLGRLGDSTLISNPSGDVYQDPDTGWIIDNSGPTTVIYDNNGNVVSPNNTPSPVGRQNPSPVAGSASNAGITTVTVRPPSTVPGQSSAVAISTSSIGTLALYGSGALLLLMALGGGRRR